MMGIFIHTELSIKKMVQDRIYFVYEFDYFFFFFLCLHLSDDKCELKKYLKTCQVCFPNVF